MKNVFGISLMIAFLAFFSACTSNKTDNKEAENNTEASIEKTRSMNATKVHKAYDYKSLATFKKGEYTLQLDDLSKLEGKNVNLVVLYETDAPWANVFNSGDVSKTGDEKFNELIGIYNLAIVKQFELDAMNEGLVLEPNGDMGDPVQAARDISMIDYVLMVHVKEVPAEELETADND